MMKTKGDYIGLINIFTAQKMKFSIKDFLNKCDQIRILQRIRSHSVKKIFRGKNFIFCAVMYKTFLIKHFYHSYTHFIETRQQCSITVKFWKFLGLSVRTSIYESLAGCRTMVIFAIFCKIGALERSTYWLHVKLIFIVIFSQSFKLDVRA